MRLAREKTYGAGYKKIKALYVILLKLIPQFRSLKMDRRVARRRRYIALSFRNKFYIVSL